MNDVKGIIVRTLARPGLAGRPEPAFGPQRAPGCDDGSMGAGDGGGDGAGGRSR